MRVALIQLAPTDNLEANLSHAGTMIAEAVSEKKPDLVVLPEMWSCLGGTKATKVSAAEVFPEAGREGGRIYEALRGFAVQHGIWVHGGSVGEKVIVDGHKKLANTSLIFDPQGRECGRYRKIHLFDVITPNGDGYQESETYSPGETVETVEIADALTGLAICYDVRFAELFLALRAADVEMIVLPAAFTQQTGEAHWEILVRARAIEAQAWVVACGTAGWHVDAAGNRRQTFGHSMIVDPWGETVLQLGGEAGWGCAEIDLAQVREVRQRMPVQSNRRLI